MVNICERFDRLGFDDPEILFRLGIMGGTFDPIHIGHLAAAEQARVDFGLDAVIFMPACVPVFKKDRAITEAADRYDMCKMACLSNPYFDASRLEIDHGGDSYTVDTIRALRAYYPPNVEFYFITGADAMMSIHRWRESSVIADLAHLIAITRPGYLLTEEQKLSLGEKSHFHITYLEVTALAISSSYLRQRVSQGKSIRYLTMQNVLEFIRDKGLYRESI